MTDLTTTPITGNGIQSRRTPTSASSRLRRSRKGDDDLLSTEISRQNTKDIDVHDIPDEELRDKRRQKLERPKVMQKMYEKSCTRYKVVPVRQYLETPDNHIVSLPNYNLGSLGVQALSVPLMLHDSITRLDLCGNDMGVRGVQALVDALKGNTSVTELNLSENKLQTAGALAMREFLREHPVLQTISLSGNGFKDNDSIIFVQVMKDNQRLKHVDFSHNEFAETAGKQFRQVLTDTDNLETFNISWNHLRRKGAMDLLAGVKKNYGLRVLDISFNGFSSEGAGVMANVLKRNRTLQDIDMRHNRLNDADLINIATKMDANDSLRVLKLGDNHFSPAGALVLLTVLLNPDNVIALEVLDLGNTCVNEDFDFIANELKTSRPNLTIKYGRVVKMRKMIPRRNTEAEHVHNVSDDQKKETEGQIIGRANTLPNMTTTATETDDMEFTPQLESIKSAVGQTDPESAVGQTDPESSVGQTDPESAVRQTDPESALGQTDPETAVGQTDINPSDPSRNNKNETIYPDITIKEESINVYNAINDVSYIKELSTTIEEKTPVLASDLEDTKGNKTRDVNIVKNQESAGDKTSLKKSYLSEKSGNKDSFTDATQNTTPDYKDSFTDNKQNTTTPDPRNLFALKRETFID